MLEVLRKSDPERLARLEGMGYDTSKVYFHGSPRTDISGFGSGEYGLFGQGAYFTDNPEIASKYAQRTSSANLHNKNLIQRMYNHPEHYGQTVYPVFLKKENSINMDVAPSSEDIKKWSEFYKILKISPEAIENQKTNESIFRLAEDIMKGDNDYIGYDTADEIENALQEAGIRQLNHLGGGRMGKIRHDVKIMKDPHNFTGQGEQIKSIWAKGRGPGLLGGFAAMPNMNPLEDLRKFVDKYREVQGPLADRITEEVSKPFGGADEGLKTLGRIGFDPLNVGAAGEVMGAIELLTPEQKKEKLMKSMEKK